MATCTGDLHQLCNDNCPHRAKHANSTQGSHESCSLSIAHFAPPLGACLRIRPCFGLAPGFPPGFGLFGLGPALGAHSPPQLPPAPQVRRQIFSRLWVKQISRHSAVTFSRPRNCNRRIPRANSIGPKTGSTICFR
jgi:hypothetical protein